MQAALIQVDVLKKKKIRVEMESAGPPSQAVAAPAPTETAALRPHVVASPAVTDFCTENAPAVSRVCSSTIAARAATPADPFRLFLRPRPIPASASLQHHSSSSSSALSAPLAAAEQAAPLEIAQPIRSASQSVENAVLQSSPSDLHDNLLADCAVTMGCSDPHGSAELAWPLPFLSSSPAPAQAHSSPSPPALNDKTETIDCPYYPTKHSSSLRTTSNIAASNGKECTGAAAHESSTHQDEDVQSPGNHQIACDHCGKYFTKRSLKHHHRECLSASQIEAQQRLALQDAQRARTAHLISLASASTSSLQLKAQLLAARRCGGGACPESVVQEEFAHLCQASDNAARELAILNGTPDPPPRPLDADDAMSAQDADDGLCWEDDVYEDDYEAYEDFEDYGDENADDVY